MARLGKVPGIVLLLVGLALCRVSMAQGEPATVVMLGDSTTLSMRSRPGHKLTDYVKANLDRDGGRAVWVVNAGQCSDTVRGAYERLERDVFSHDPDVVTMSFGLNDTMKLTPDEFREWLKKTVEAIQRRTSATLLLVTSTPFDSKRYSWRSKCADKGDLDEYMDTNICAQMRNVAKEFNVPLCDLHSYFKSEFKKNPSLIKHLIRSDGIHLTEDGNKVAAKYLSPMIRAQVDRSGPKASDVNKPDSDDGK